MTLHEIDGPLEEPRQYWTLGGVQLIHDRGHAAPEGRLAHLGLMCEDLDTAVARAIAHGVESLPRGCNWLRLPDGLCLELMQASPVACVDRALAIDPRAEDVR